MLPVQPYAPGRFEDAARPYARWMHSWPAGAPPPYVQAGALTRLLGCADLAAGDVEALRLEVAALRAAMRRLIASQAGLEAELEALRPRKRPASPPPPRRSTRRK